MNALLSALCLVFSLSCEAPSVYQDAGQASSGGHAGKVVIVESPRQSHTHKGVTQLSASNENGSLMLVLHGDDKVTALLDGEVLPKERIVRDGDHLRIDDEHGNTLFDIRVLANDGGLIYPYDSSSVTGWSGAAGWADALRKEQEESSKPRKMIGVSTESLGASLAAQLGVKPDEAILVTEIYPDMPAEKAGLKLYDVVLKIDGEGSVTPDRLGKLIRGKETGQELTLSLLREGKPLDLKVPVEEVSGDKLSRIWKQTGIGTDAATWWDASAAGAAASGASAEANADELLDLARTGAAARSDELAAAQQQMRAAHDEMDSQLDMLKDELASVSSATDRQRMEDAEKKLRAALARVDDATTMLEAQHGQAQSGGGFVVGNDGRRSLFVPYASSGGSDDAALKKLEERMERLEGMLQKLLDASGKAPAPAPSDDKH